jgi:FemAB-related protein (PEP-CTERM system-associated)
LKFFDWLDKFILARKCNLLLPNKSILLTFDVEDWFQVENLKTSIPFTFWPDCELRVENNTRRLLDLLDCVLSGNGNLSASSCEPPRATFFILGWIAKRVPQLVREIAARGHEVASHGSYHKLCYEYSAKELKDDLSDSKKILEDITGLQVYGYRAPSFSIGPEVLKIIAECGYTYDSSYNSFAGNSRYGHLDVVRTGKSIACRVLPSLYELPISNFKIGNCTIPMGGGGYFRLMPNWLFKRAVRSIIVKEGAYLFYMHPWEIDPGQPRVRGLPFSYRFRHYVNLDKSASKLADFVKSIGGCQFLTCRSYIDHVLASEGVMGSQDMDKARHYEKFEAKKDLQGPAVQYLSNLYQLPEWRQIIKSTYGHQTYYLTAVKDGPQTKIAFSDSGDHSDNNLGNGDTKVTRVDGILPLVHLKSLLFGNDLISMPFFDSGGISADDPDVERALLSEAVSLARSLKAKTIQLRQTVPLISLPESGGIKSNQIVGSWLTDLGCTVQKRIDKAQMLLELPDSPEALMGRFKSKLRSQIRKPIKEGLVAKVGGLELLDDFYKVFSINMRDLGSPVHSKHFLKGVMQSFQDTTRICMAFDKDLPLACSIIIGFNDVLYNPWASSLREYSRLSPNMLLYWTMLQYACDNGYKFFDFGRSSIYESTYKFKEQWGAQPNLLHWYYISLNNIQSQINTEKSKFDLAIRVWQKLPVHLTQIIGPPIRKHIGL